MGAGRRNAVDKAPRQPDPDWELIKMVVAEGYKYFAWPFEDATPASPDAARACIVRYCDGLVAAMLARSMQLRIASAAADVMRKAIVQLSEADRALLLIRCRENMSMEDIAGRLGCTANAARRRCRRMFEELGAHGRAWCTKTVLH